jgi:hypothetical protein
MIVFAKLVRMLVFVFMALLNIMSLYTYSNKDEMHLVSYENWATEALFAQTLLISLALVLTSIIYLSNRYSIERKY